MTPPGPHTIPPKLHLWQLRGEHAALGILAALAHAITAAAAFLRWNHSSSRCWLFIAIALASISIDRCLGLLAALSKLIRRRLREQGRYWTVRRPVQWLGSLGVVVLTILAVRFGLGKVIGPASRRFAWFSTVFLSAFVLLRSLSLHEFDGLLYRRRLFPRLPLSFLIELLTDALIVAAIMFDV